VDVRSDEALLCEARADAQAFAEFYRRHVAKVEAFAARRLACQAVGHQLPPGSPP
jgi:hypothetical protein